MSAEQKKLDEVTKHRDQLKAELDALNPKHNAALAEIEKLKEQFHVAMKKLEFASRAVDELEKKQQKTEALLVDAANSLTAQQQRYSQVENQLKAVIEATRKETVAWQEKAQKALRRDSESFDALQQIVTKALAIINMRAGVAELNKPVDVSEN